jgi:hypothetical protein
MVDLVTGSIALAIALVFLAIPAVKLASLPLAVVILIGVAAMVWSLVEAVRERQRR